MKKIIIAILTACLIFSAVACAPANTEPTDPSETKNIPSIDLDTPTTSTEEQATPDVHQLPMISVSVPAVTESQTTDDGTVLFQYTYQTISLVLPNPEVANKVIIDFLNRIDGTRSDAESVAQLAQNDYNNQSNWIPYLYHITYNPMRIDPKVLSLFGNHASYSGANHPDRSCLSTSYDLLTGDVLTLGSIMNAKATTSDFCRLVLEGLTEIQQKDYLYDGYEDSVRQRFQEDENLDQKWYFSQNGLCFYFEPYEIAPYTSGVITVEIPYEKLKDLLYESYLPEDRDITNGTITIAPFESAELSQFSQISEVIQDNEGVMHLIYSENAVQNVRIRVSDAVDTYTIFAAYALTPGDAVMVQADEDVLKTMKISYESNGETHTQTLISE
ncbi:MAG: DUF3298 domain-containing protein [Oscillospiraceae bacterium]|nr:DUF3298 domain-containing protein [Oscillospiraceae bacterium]